MASTADNETKTVSAGRVLLSPDHPTWLMGVFLATGDFAFGSVGKIKNFQDGVAAACNAVVRLRGLCPDGVIRVEIQWHLGSHYSLSIQEEMKKAKSIEAVGAIEFILLVDPNIRPAEPGSTVLRGFGWGAMKATEEKKTTTTTTTVL